jgi:hypothetical protein
MISSGLIAVTGQDKIDQIKKERIGIPGGGAGAVCCVGRASATRRKRVYGERRVVNWKDKEKD